MIWLNDIVFHKDTAFLNIDSLRPERPLFDDSLHDFHSYYESSFNFHNKMLKASSYGRDVLCVKRLIMQPKPAVKFHRSSFVQSTANVCPHPYSSSLLHLFNRLVLKNIGVSPSPSLEGGQTLTVAIFYRPLIEVSRESAINREMANVQNARLDPVAHHLNDISNALEDIAKVRIIKIDLQQVQFLEQVKAAMQADVIVSSSSSGGVMHLLHMPYISNKCCGLVEVVNQKSKHASGLVGHAHLAQSMGATYIKIKWDGATTSSTSEVDITDKIKTSLEGYRKKYTLHHQKQKQEASFSLGVC